MFRLTSITAIVSAICVCGFAALFAGGNLLACGGYHAAYIEDAMASELAADGSFDQNLIEQLRKFGYAALDDLRERKTTVEKQLVVISQRSYASKEQQAEYVRLTQQVERLTRLIDQVGGQRYCTTSGLFWHKDLDAARVESKRTHKPILSLRMLGKLTDEYSCANSRFFRTTLYGNEAIAKNLRENFVLHWKSVRPVPRITIDFGDGRKLERTITGNSAHYLLDSTGRPLDCLPGLYGPGAFTGWLERSKKAVTTWAQLDASEKDEWLVEYHKNRNRQLGIGLQQRMRSLDPEFAAKAGKAVKPKSGKRVAKDVRPLAIEAAPIARSKYSAERPILKLAFQAGSIDRFEKQMDDELWANLAAQHAGMEKLDAKSIELIRNENPTAAEAGKLTISKVIVEDPLIRLVQNFQQNILLDTVRNEYLLHRRIHSWFENTGTKDVEALNRRVYAELFLTPDSDPWLGLKPNDVYTALENDGVSVAAAK